VVLRLRYAARFKDNGQLLKKTSPRTGVRPPLSFTLNHVLAPLDDRRPCGCRLQATGINHGYSERVRTPPSATSSIVANRGGTAEQSVPTANGARDVEAPGGARLPLCRLQQIDNHCIEWSRNAVFATPNRTMTPLRASISINRPAIRSACIEINGIRRSRLIAADHIVGKPNQPAGRLPRAPTAMHS